MSERIPLAATVRFGTFELDLESHELRRRGLLLRIEEKSFQVLAHLVEKPGQVVTRTQLRDKLWPGIFVGYEQGLNTAVNKLRNLLGDSAQSPRFVETIPRVGYRFLAEVKREAQAPDKKMLLILPFENLSGDPSQRYFADGLTEELISRLSVVNPDRLGVIARTSAMHYRGTTKTVREIAAEVKVGYVLEGSVRKERHNVRVTTQLIDALSELPLWSRSYERELYDILRVQDDVASSVGRSLATELLLPSRDSRESTDPIALEGHLRKQPLIA